MFASMFHGPPAREPTARNSECTNKLANLHVARRGNSPFPSSRRSREVITSSPSCRSSAEPLNAACVILVLRYRGRLAVSSCVVALSPQVLAMTMAEPGSRMSLKFKLEGTKGDLGRWGHEYPRSLAGEIGQEYSARRMRIVKGAESDEGEGEGEGMKAMDADADAEEADVSDLIELVDDIVPFHLQHNAEAEAVDLLVEVQVGVLGGESVWCAGCVCSCATAVFGLSAVSRSFSLWLDLRAL